MTEDKGNNSFPRKRGRPLRKDVAKFTFLLSNNLREKLVVYCDKYALNMTQAIEKAIRELVDNDI